MRSTALGMGITAEIPALMGLTVPVCGHLEG